MSTVKKTTSKKRLMQILRSNPEDFRIVDDFLNQKTTQKEWLREYHQWKKKQEK
jgi:hypothetical protein|tara:strand:+ start:33 stop:194 length:162 start_codon:yes stop_codon:yes gene_type:complete